MMMRGQWFLPISSAVAGGELFVALITQHTGRREDRVGALGGRLVGSTRQPGGRTGRAAA